MKSSRMTSALVFTVDPDREHKFACRDLLMDEEEIQTQGHISLYPCARWLILYVPSSAV